MNTPKANQIKLSLIGLRNSGKSSLMNNLFSDDISIISETPGTTTDPVSKSMEINGLGAVNIHDTAGFDDEGALGNLRNKKTIKNIENSNVIIFCSRADKHFTDIELNMLNNLSKYEIPVVIASTFSDKSANDSLTGSTSYKQVSIDNISGKGISMLLKTISDFKSKIEFEITPLEGLVNENDLLLLVAPIDLAAPKERLIQPQVATLRDSLDKDCASLLVKERELHYFYNQLKNPPKIVITDSQAFSKVAADIPEDQMLTSFSILFARKKGDLYYYVKSIKQMEKLKGKCRVLIMEACSHHRQADDIGTVKIPRLFRQIIQPDTEFIFSKEVPEKDEIDNIDLVIMCASCMINRTTVMNRLSVFRKHSIPVVNYGLFLAYANGLLPRAIEPFPEVYSDY